MYISRKFKRKIQLLLQKAKLSYMAFNKISTIPKGFVQSMYVFLKQFPSLNYRNCQSIFFKIQVLKTQY